MPTQQNFSVPSGDDRQVEFTIAAADMPSGDIVDVYWQAFDQAYGVPTSTVPVVQKTSEGSPGDIDYPASPGDVFTVDFIPADTSTLLGNYYHEARVVDGSGNISTVIYGVMTVTQTEVVT